MKILRYFKSLSKFETTLLCSSLLLITVSFLLCPDKDILSLSASLIGATALIFVAKGMVIGQVLTVAFSIFYGIISYHFGYYGEMITYLAMSAPAAVFAIISWLRHPYGEGDEVKVSERLSAKQRISVVILTISVTVIFYFILSALNTKNLIFSTISVATSMLASSLVFLRSPFYALAYAANDIALITLWALAALIDIGYVPMILCFVVFLANDIYAFVNWCKMKKRQEKAST